MEYSSKDRKFAGTVWDGKRWVKSDKVQTAPVVGGPDVETHFAAALAREYKDEMESGGQARWNKRWKTCLYFYEKRQKRERRQWLKHRELWTTEYLEDAPSSHSFTVVGSRREHGNV